MSDVKQVKVDNWGIYFLQRLKHFFNRTDYCDLTLQFQDNAQLKVHRLVLSACTEYFELLERTCEMYEDCLVMPDDLQADVVVPIVNFMYTGHLEFKMDLLERLYQTSQILNMPVLSKLLESHRSLAPKAPAHSYSGIKKLPKQTIHIESSKTVKNIAPAGSSNKRSYSKAFDNNIVYREKKTYQSNARTENVNSIAYRPPSPISKEHFISQKTVVSDPRPTRYEVPEELDTDNIFDNSFCSISYTSQPLMVHPDTVKRYKAKRSNVFTEASGSKKISSLSTIDIVECKRITPKEDNLFDDSNTEQNFNDETDLFSTSYINNEKDPNQLFDQILDNNDGNSGPKVTIETKDSKAASNLDHAKIISEVLKKYPHLVKSNKNIKLKILDPVPSNKGKKQQKQVAAPTYEEDKPVKFKTEVADDFTYETDVIDSKQAAKLIAMGAENTKGPWICLICGTPGKALHFNSYYKFRRHLVEVHNEKPVANICEYCGLRSLKRNYLLHHLYAQHGVQPPPQYHFPKCSMCNYIALTDALLTKHKMGHKTVKNFRCNVCSVAFSTSNQLLQHIQNTGHKYSAEKKSNLQCIYCMKVFLREINLYSHIKSHHKREAKTDGVIDDSDEDKPIAERTRPKAPIKFEPSTSYDNDYEVDLQYPVQQRPTDKQVPARRQHNVISNLKQKILNPGFDAPKAASPKPKTSKSTIHNQSVHNDFFQDIKIPMEPLSNNQNEEIVLIDNNEYIMKDNQLIPRKRKPNSRDYMISDVVETESLETIQQPTTSEYTHVQNTTIEENVPQQSSMVIKKSANLNQPIQIVVSNEEEYKALMASNHPIIFDDGGTNKTLTVLTAPHHNQAIETSAIDLDNTQGNEMMILPHEYPLNVSEGVATENSNIVVVYSHPVDDQKQFQIITTGGIEAQFVQSSAIITQNFETVTTSTSAMNTHCIETQVEQTWQNNIQNLEGQQIQLPPHTVMLDSNQIITGSIHSTGDNLDELPEVHLVPESQKELSQDETVVTLNQSDVTIEQMNQQVGNMDNNVPVMTLIEKETNVSETIESHHQGKSMPDIQTNPDNVEEPMEIGNMQEQPTASEHELEQPIRTENILEQQMQAENVLEQPMETVDVQHQQMQTENMYEQPTTEIVLAQPMETENVTNQTLGTQYVVEQPLVTENVMVLEQPLENEIEQTTINMVEQPVETGNMMESLETENTIVQHVETGNVLQQPVETETPIEQPVELVNMMEQTAELENVIEQPVERENVIEQPIQTQCLIVPSLASQNQQEHTLDPETINKYSEVRPDNDTSESQQQPELMESQAYDEIVEINRANEEEPRYVKDPEKKIKNLTLDWSEDEYDVAEDGNRNAKSVSNEASQNAPLVEEMPEVEESIENIQQEMQKQLAEAQLEVETAAQLVAGGAAQLDVEAAAQLQAADVDTEESAVSSPEEDSSSQEMQLPPLHDSPVPNTLVQEKLSSLLNDWEDNDSQEEMADQTVEPTPEESTNETDVVSPNIPEVPKNDNIKSLVSDWSDDEEEIKE
ncbi:hypothetical protein PYW07_002692 [Mythimna separata]|uniref:Centrosome-associated zinc finger protein CP190 n=1 Tax=Mythimna separata TaxID=271217 RepID=A0AAD7YG57_MYTSE|nr:hypothetical protein PYW07_002692 [Mythimna separata]